MSKNTVDLPFVELVERTVKTARVEGGMDRARAAVQDQATYVLPRKDDWPFLMLNSAIAADPEYTTGVATVNTQNTSVTFSGGTSLDATMTGRRIKFSGHNNVYTLTFSSATVGIISPPLAGNTNLSSVAFSINQPVYALAADFERFPKNGGLQQFFGGKLNVIPERTPQKYYANYQASPSDNVDSCRVISIGTGGTLAVELTPPPKTAVVLPYEYLPRVDPLRATTNGTATVAGGATTVNFQQGAFLAEAETGWFFRVDAFGTGQDSEWYRVISISAANSTCTLQTAFGVSGATSAGYTLSAVPKFPPFMHLAIHDGAVTSILADQNDPLYAFHDSRASAALIDARMLLRSRQYPQEIDTVMEEYHWRR